MKWIYPLLVIVVILYLITADFKLNDTEFILVTLLLIFILTRVTSTTELFDIDELPEKETLFGIPKIFSDNIGPEIDKLIKDATPKEEDKKMTDDVISKTTFQEDEDMHNSKQQVDDAKFSLLRREYLIVNQMLLQLKDTDTQLYNRIFPETNDDGN